MKLPTILAQATPAAGYGANYAQARSTGLEAAAGAGREVATDVGQMAAFEQQRARVEQATQVAEIETTTTGALGQLELDLKQGKRDPTTGVLTEPPATEADYFKRWQDGWKRIRSDALGSAKDPVAQQAAGRLLDRLGSERAIKAQVHEHSLWLDKENAAFDVREADYAKRAALDPDPTRRESARAMFRADAAAASGTYKTQVEVGKRLKDFDEKVWMVHANQAVDAGTFNADEYVDKIDPIKLHGLRIRALAIDEKRQRQAEQLWKESREQALGQFAASALSGQYKTTDLLESLAGMTRTYRLNDTEVKRLHDMAVSPPKEKASDEATLRAVVLDSNLITPRIPTGTLNSYLDAGLLNHKDWQSAVEKRGQADKHRESIVRADQATARTEENIARTIGMQQHTQAEQELLKALGVITPFSKLDATAEKLAPQVFSELRRRSNAFPGGQEPPLKVLEDLLPTVQRTLGADAALNKQELLKLTAPYQSPGELEAAAKAGRITQSTYEAKKKYFLQIDEINRRENLMEQPPAPKAGGGKPGAAKPTGGGGGLNPFGRAR